MLGSKPAVELPTRSWIQRPLLRALQPQKYLGAGGQNRARTGGVHGLMKYGNDPSKLWCGVWALGLGCLSARGLRLGLFAAALTFTLQKGSRTIFEDDRNVRVWQM
ncbi:hypothetical protein P154DRAFT_535517 [Amniculicola lignicola CBS 123094]|uniref:Uncharacterized protein n=1 Tax=Amniculicola lignicola CBS 123094 TaxID=1392246 RepID=A0A6A5WCY5_9PLEO|nr:hypothetical protein P154DRAFT_535517 [Amniculicola lignicola CBS 123094]